MNKEPKPPKPEQIRQIPRCRGRPRQPLPPPRGRYPLTLRSPSRPTPTSGPCSPTRPPSTRAWRVLQPKVIYFKRVQLNLHETDLLFWYLSHHFTWHCLLIYGFSPIFPSFVCCDHKIVLHWYENQNKNNLVIMLCKSWEILGNQLTISTIVTDIVKL